MPGPRVAVVGCGILGTAIAWRLARGGARAVLLEREAPAAGATGRSFGWLNASFGNRSPYFELRMDALRAWRELESELDGATQVRFCGSLLWLDPGGERLLERLVESHRGLGYAVRLVSRAEIERLEPALAPAPALAALASDEGAVDSARATRVLLERALAEGAELRCPCAARSLVRRGARVVGVETERGEVAADVVVLAAGAATPALAAAAGASVPLVEAPGILVRTRPAPPLARRVLLTQRAQVWQARDGSLVVGDALGRPGEVGPSEVERVLAAVRSFLPAAAGVGPAEARLGWRPMPRDERPIAGFAREAPGLYLAVAHSGVTLAPLLGRLVADEILSGGPSPALAAYRPERFASVTHEPA